MLPSPASRWGGRGALRILASGEGGLSQAASESRSPWWPPAVRTEMGKSVGAPRGLFCKVTGPMGDMQSRVTAGPCAARAPMGPLGEVTVVPGSQPPGGSYTWVQSAGWRHLGEVGSRGWVALGGTFADWQRASSRASQPEPPGHSWGRAESLAHPVRLEPSGHPGGVCLALGAASAQPGLRGRLRPLFWGAAAREPPASRLTALRGCGSPMGFLWAQDDPRLPRGPPEPLFSNVLSPALPAAPSLSPAPSPAAKLNSAFQPAALWSPHVRCFP